MCFLPIHHHCDLYLSRGHGCQQPLHERNNWPTSTHSRREHNKHKPTDRHNNNNNHNHNQNNNNNNGLSELIQSSPSPGYASDLFDEEEHERRRQSERHMPAPPLRIRRRKSAGKLPHQPRTTTTDDPDSSSKENEEENEMVTVARPVAPLSEPDDSPMSHSSSSTQGKDKDGDGEEGGERSASPVESVSSPSPPLELSTLRHAVDSSEPVPSRSFRHPQGGDRLVSPRNSIVMTRRIFSTESSSNSDIHISQMSKQIHSLKRKMKRFEEGFEKEFGYRPSVADKMSDPETKKWCSLLTKLRKEMKNLKEEGPSSSPAIEKEVIPEGSPESKTTSQTGKQEAIIDIEKKLMEKRVACGRPELVEDMSREQLVEEKLAVQKSLLQLENTYGRPTTKHDRDIVRPIYDRYRLLKRLLARNASSKLKENGTELGTILEHETMDFTSSSPPPPASSPTPPPAPVPTAASPPDLENLHAMPLTELLKQQQMTREEKKRLRRSLREFEEECQKTIGRKLSREDRLPMEQTYAEYKHAKAKLRLLEALLMKQK